MTRTNTDEDATACDLCGGRWRVLGHADPPSPSGVCDAGTRQVPVLRCVRCGSLRLGVAQVAVDDFLQKGHYNDPSTADADARARGGFLTWVRDRFFSALPPNPTIVDFGSSFGHLAWLLGDQGAVVIGVESCARARELAASRVPEARFVGSLSELRDLTETVDAVTAIDSLYYLGTPRTELAQMAGLLRPGGMLVIRSTNGALRAWAFRLARALPTGGRHPVGDALWAFTPAGMATAAEAVGFEVTRTVFAEGGKSTGWRGTYRRLSTGLAVASGGLIRVTPGWLMVARKIPAAAK